MGHRPTVVTLTPRRTAQYVRPAVRNLMKIMMWTLETDFKLLENLAFMSKDLAIRSIHTTRIHDRGRSQKPSTVPQDPLWAAC